MLRFTDIKKVNKLFDNEKDIFVNNIIGLEKQIQDGKGSGLKCLYQAIQKLKALQENNIIDQHMIGSYLD